MNSTPAALYIDDLPAAKVIKIIERSRDGVTGIYSGGEFRVRYGPVKGGPKRDKLCIALMPMTRLYNADMVTVRYAGRKAKATIVSVAPIITINDMYSVEVQIKLLSAFRKERP